MRAEGADVVIVGGGVIGLGVGWRAATAGLRVTVCDPSPGRGASWAAAGMLAPVTEARAEEADLVGLGLESIRRWPGFAAELTADSDLDVGLRQDGTLQVAFDADDHRSLDEVLDVQRSLGLGGVRCSAGECRDLEPLLSPRVRGGLQVGGDWQVDSRAVVTALAAAFRRRGGCLRTSAVRRVRCAAGRVSAVELDDSTILPAGAVVLAAGAYSATIGGVPPEARPPVRPVKGQILRLQADPADPVVTRTVRAIVRGVGVYIVPRLNGEVVVGASMEEAGFDTTVRAGTVSDLLRAAIEVVPAAGELRLAETMARLRPATPDNGPVLGPTAVNGLLLATGHHRNGMLLAPVTADALVAVLVGRPLPGEAAAFVLERFA